MKILISSVGGLGVGVFVEWLSVAAILEGLYPNTLSQPGVGQRAGRTVSYLEISEGPNELFSPFPEKGSVDLIISQEFLELLRLLKDGYGGKNTKILGTTYRYYTTREKLSLTPDPYTYQNMRAFIEDNSAEHIIVDVYESKVTDFGNAYLLGVLLASGYLTQIKKESYEEAIKKVGVAPERNLRDFSLGFELASEISSKTGQLSSPRSPKPTDTDLDFIKGQELRESVENLGSVYGNNLHTILVEALKQLVDYQDAKYAKLYMRRLLDLYEFASEKAGVQLTADFMQEFSKVLAVRMMYEDIIRVAQKKTSIERFKRIRRLFRIGDKDVFWITDFFKPELDELYGILPNSLGKFFDRVLSKYRFSLRASLNTNHVFGFLMLKFMSKLRFLRRYSYRYSKENLLIGEYIEHVKRSLGSSPDSAALAARGGAIVRGYGSIRRDMIDKWKEFSDLREAKGMEVFLNKFFSEKRFAAL